MSEKVLSKAEMAWEKYKDENPPKGNARFYFKDNREYWIDGYNKAYDQLTEVNKVLLEALKDIFDMGAECGDFESRRIASDALAKAKEMSK